MKTVDILAFEDRSRPAGGYAVICLLGLTAISRNATFVLRPLDGTLDAAEAEHWPKGESVPLETRTADGGIELVVGPGFVDNPLLVPGTPVVIDLPHEGVSGEFLWPSVTLASRPRRRSLQSARPAAEPARPDAPKTSSTLLTSPSAPRRIEPVAKDMSTNEAPTRTVARDRVHDTVQDARSSATDDPPFYTSARFGSDVPSSTAASLTLTDALPKSRLGVAVAAVAVVLALQALGYVLFGARHSGDVTRDVAAKSRAAETGIYAALHAGDTSPAGIKANGVPAPRILELADASLFGDPAARNTEEAAFWLKRYLIANNDERARRAMTQLGTTFAAPSRGTPDYASARQIWEIAAAHGDAVAICFIAKLHEGGLGGAADRAAAIRWTEMARASGGCSTP